MIKTCLLSFMAFLFFGAANAQFSFPKNNQPVFKTSGPMRSGTFVYALTTSSQAYTDLVGATSLNEGEIWDEPEYSFPIGFPFELNGENISGLSFIGSGSIMGAPSGDPDVLKLLFPFEADLVDRGATNGINSESPISYLVEGTAGSRILKLEFKNAGSYFEMDEQGTTDMFVNFQMWLYEGSNRIEFRYGPSDVADPVMFYGGESGPFAGLSDLYIPDDEGINSHFLSGSVSNPNLSSVPTPLSGTPSEGTVYALFLNLPLETEVTGENSTSSCAPNGTATATPSGGIEPYTYAWSNGETTQSISDLDAGTYTVTVSDDEGTTATGSVTITGPDELIANASATDETSPGANDGTATSSPTGGSPLYTYAWDNGETTATITNLAPDTYRVTVTDESGCTDWQDVTVNAAGCGNLTLETSVTQTNCFDSCDGMISIVQVNGGISPYSYVWEPSGSTTSDLTDLCAGTYFVTVTDADGCVIEESYTVTSPAQLLANAAASSETAPGANDGSAWAAPSGGTPPFTYLWNNGSTDSLITNLSPGEYTVSVTDDQMCTATQTVNVTAFGCALLEAQIIDNSCFQSCDGSITPVLINMVEPVTFLWSTGDTASTLTDLCAGGYSFTATDAEGCTVTGSHTVSEPTEIFANASFTNETQPSGNDGTAWAVPTGGVAPYTYLWSNGSTDSLITGLPPSLYFVIVTDAIGCADTAIVFVLEFPCAGELLAMLNDASCFEVCDASISISLEGGVGPYVINWGNGATGSALVNLCAGLYDVTLTDEGQGCTFTATVPVDEPNPLVITIDTLVDITDTTDSAISISVTGGTSPYSIQWAGPGGFTSSEEDLSGIEPGLYTIAVIDASGCMTSMDSIEIFDNTVGIRDPESLNVLIHPNPANQEVIIDIPDVTLYIIRMNTMDGRLLRTWENEKRLDVSSLPAGVYILQFTSGIKYMAHKLVIAR